MEPGKVYPTRAATKGVKDEKRISIGECRVSPQEISAKLRNFRASPKFGVTYDGRGLRNGKDFVATFIRNTEKGTGYIMIRGIGKYKDWMMVPFTIE